MSWRRWWRMRPWRRRNALPRPAAMSPEEQRRGLAVADTNAMWRALMSVLEEHTADATALVRAPQTAAKEGMLEHTAGGLDSLLTLQEDLEARREEAMKGEEEGKG